jgi:hypothetical protein
MGPLQNISRAQAIKAEVGAVLTGNELFITFKAQG